MKSLQQFLEAQNFLIKGHTKKQHKDPRNIYYYKRTVSPYSEVYVMELKSNKELLILKDNDNLTAEEKDYLTNLYNAWHEGTDLVIYCGFRKKDNKITLDAVGDRATKKSGKKVSTIDFADFSKETWIKNNWV